MTLMRWKPFDIFLDAFGAEPQVARSAPFVPVDVAETEDAYVVEADMPGMEVSAELDGELLRISGKRTGSAGKRQERFSGKAERLFALPEDADKEAVTAEYRHGVLRATIPRRKTTTHDARRRIDVKML